MSEDGSMTSLELLRAIYRNPEVPLPVRMRAAGMALPFESPKLAVVATFDGSGDFALKLDQAVERSRKVAPTMIEARANDTANVPSNTQRPQPLNGKPTILDRRFRSW